MKALFAAALIAASTAVVAQAPAAPGDAAKERRQVRVDCLKAADPKACEARLKERQARREKAREAHDKARRACEGKKGAEHRACIGSAMCAQTADPAKCQQRLDARAEKRRSR